MRAGYYEGAQDSDCCRLPQDWARALELLAGLTRPGRLVQDNDGSNFELATRNDEFKNFEIGFLRDLREI